MSNYIEPAFRSLLIGDNPVKAIVDDRVWLGSRPQNERRPGVVLTLTVATHPHTFEEHGGYVQGTMQADCLAPDYKTAKQLADAVKNALDTYMGTVNGLVIDFIETDSESDIPRLPLEGQAVPSFGVSLEFSFQYQR
jgi:hypothetical protein